MGLLVFFLFFTAILHYLSVIPAIQCHTMIPEVLEEVRQDFVLYVLSFHTVRCAALLYHLFYFKRR